MNLIKKGMKNILIAISLFFIITGSAFGTNSPQTARWENFTDMKNVISISIDKNLPLAYCASTGGLYVINITTGEVLKKYTNIDGLITNNITSTVIDNQNKLWIGGADGSISILDYNQSSWKYIYDIKTSTEADKTINGFVVYNNYVYVSTGYGIQKISSSTLNFVDAPYYQLGTFADRSRVFSTAILNDKIYAGTANGIAYANLINTNLNTPSNWTNYDSIPMTSNVRTIEAFNNLIFAGSDTGFVYFNGANWMPYPNASVQNIKIKKIKGIGDKLFFITGNSVYYSQKDSLQNITPYYNTDKYNTITSSNNNIPLIGVYEKGVLYNLNNNFVNVAPNCPYRNNFDFVNVDGDGNVWGCSAIPSGSLSYEGGFYKFDGKTWVTYNNLIFPVLGSSSDFRKIYSNKNNNMIALGWGNGVAMLSDPTNIRLFTPMNSSLPGISGSPNFCVPTGGGFDSYGYFWCSFYGSNFNKSVYVYTGDTNWVGFTNPSVIINSNLEALAVDNYNTKWIVSGEGAPRGLYYFNENGTIYEPSDDISGFYALGDFSADVNDISYVIVDKNNSVWVATNNGVFIIDNPLAVIQPPFSKPAPQKLGIISGNLKVPFTENCKSITIDILNQKWIGTQSNGVFHLSDDGSTLIEQYNVINSPILSNSINSIVVNPKNGKAYIGTANGLSSVQTDAVQPVENFDKIVCAPNPFIVPARVNLKIDGLVENSSVKIITLSGDVVTEFISPGGRIANWDGTDKKGNVVPTGIYIVVAYNKDGSKVGTGKVAIIRK